MFYHKIYKIYNGCKVYLNLYLNFFKRFKIDEILQSKFTQTLAKYTKPFLPQI